MTLSRVVSYLIALAAVAACGSDPVAPPEASYTISVHGGSDQQGPAGSILDEPLQVTVVDVANQPVQGVVVRFRVLGGGGSLTDSIGVTGPGGVALTFARVGAAVGPQQFEAALRRAPARRVTFEATATDPARLIRISAGSTLVAGDTVDIIGDNFNTNPGGNSVFFGTTRGRILSVEGDTLLRTIVPFCVASGATAVHVQVGSAVTNTLSVSYAPTSPTLQLAVGEGITVGVADLERCLQLPGTGPRYLVVPQFASTADDPIFTPFKIGWTGTATAAPTAPQPTRSGTAASFTRRATAQGRVDALMRDIEREIAPQLAGQDNEQESLVLEALVLNSSRSFQVISDLGEEGKSPTFGTSVARLRYIGEHILIYVDQRSVSTISEAEMTRIGLLFDARLYDLAVERFGSESDLDRNGKVIVLMTPFVNALVTRQECQAESFVAGYFYPNDLFLRNANSNKGEIFYTIVPDPTGTYSCPQGAAFVRRLIPGTFIHEFQHMISFNQHVLARGGGSEDVWLNEGLSLIAEEAAARFYEPLYPVPIGEVFADSAAMFIEEITVHAYEYLAASKSHSVTTFDGFGGLQERAAAWLFLRWLGDQKGDGIYARLVQTRATSVENVQRQTGESFAALFGDFSLTLAADIPDIAGFSRAALSPRHRFAPRPDGRPYRTVFERIFLKYRKATPSPVVFTALGPHASAPPQSMVQGTMAFFSLTTATLAPSALGVLFTGANGEPLPAPLVPQVGIVRVQ